MSIRGLIRSITEACRSPLGRLLLLSAYYVLIIMALVIMYGQGDFSSSDFVYQAF